MSSPGGTDEVGRVSIRVLPDSGGFRERLKRQLEGIEESLKLEIPVGFDVDTEGLRAQLEALEKSKVTIPVDIGDGSEIERLRTRLQALDNSQVTIPIDLDLRDLERADAVLRRLDGRSIRMNVRLNGVRQAIRDLTALDALVRRLDGRRINISIDVDAGAAIAQIAAIEAALVGVRASLGSINSGRGGGMFGGATAGALRFVGILLVIPALAAAIAAAGAAITAAWGAISTAVLAIPPALLLLAGPIAAIALGMDGIKKAAKTIKPEFDKMKQAVSDTFERGMLPVFQELVKTFPTLTAGLSGIAEATSTVALRTSQWLATAPGLALLRQNMENIRLAVVGMQPGIQNILSSILQLGAQASVMDALKTAVNEFGASFRANVTQLIGDGTLDRAMRGLRDMLVELGQGFSDLVSNGLRVFANAAPGVNRFLDSLTRFFNRFNWDSLGRSVGRVFEGLAASLDKVPTETFRKIEDAFARLGETFNDPKFQQGITDLINSLPDAIDLVDKLARGFGPLATEVAGFITSLNDIGNSAETGLRKLKEFSDWIDTQLFGSPMEVPEEWKSPLQKWVEGWLGDTDESAKKAEEAGGKIREGWERGLRGGEGTFGPKEGSFGDWLPDIGELLKDLFDPSDTTVSDYLTDLETQVRDGLTRVTEAGRQGVEQVKLAVQTGLAQLPIIAGLALTAMQLAFTNGFLAIGASLSLAMNTMVNTLTLGFVLMQTAVANGMLLLQTAFTTGWTLIQLAVDTGLLTMRTAFTEAFVQMQADATNGMLLFAAAVLAGFALVVPAVQIGMLQLVLAVQLGFQQIVAAVQTGMQQVTEAFQLNWNASVLATSNAMTEMTAAVDSGMTRMSSAVESGGQQMTTSMEQSMEQMRSAVQQGMQDVEREVRTGIDDAISTLKAAEIRFYSAGQALGDGLVRGLNSKLGDVKNAAHALGAAAAEAMAAAARVNSPSKITIWIGQMMGTGLAQGLNRSESEVDRAARSLSTTVVDSLSGIQSTLGADRWSTDFSARVNTELAQNDMGAVGAAASAGTVINNNFYTESSTRESAAVAQVQRRHASMGMFGAPAPVSTRAGAR